MTRDELNTVAALLREHGVTRGVDQALQAVDAYLALAEHHPDAAALGYEHNRALDLWQTLQKAAAALTPRPGSPLPEAAA